MGGKEGREGMTYIVMAYIVMAKESLNMGRKEVREGMAYTVMAYIVMTQGREGWSRSVVGVGAVTKMVLMADN